jgi:hypothetical protein
MPVKAAWNAVLDCLPALWRVGPPTHDGGRDRWAVTALGGSRRRVTGYGKDEIAALHDLAGRLHDVRHPDGTCADELRRLAVLVHVADAAVA